MVNGDEQVNVKSQNISVKKEALLHHVELTQNSAPIIKAYAQLSATKSYYRWWLIKANFSNMRKPTQLMKWYVNIVRNLMLKSFIDILRPLTPRLYSIASSQQEVDDEVHLTLGVVRYNVDQRAYTGGASRVLS